MKQLTPKQMIAALQLLATNKEWRKELRKAYRSVSKIGASYGRASMRSSGSRQLARAARGVKAGSNASQGYVRTYGWADFSHCLADHSKRITAVEARQEAAQADALRVERKVDRLLIEQGINPDDIR